MKIKNPIDPEIVFLTYFCKFRPFKYFSKKYPPTSEIIHINKIKNMKILKLNNNEKAIKAKNVKKIKDINKKIINE